MYAVDKHYDPSVACHKIYNILKFYCHCVYRKKIINLLLLFLHSASEETACGCNTWAEKTTAEKESCDDVNENLHSPEYTAA